MAYKFQLDDAIMSGSLVQEGAAEVVGNLTTQGIISGSGTATLFGLNVGQGVFSVSNEGAAVAASLNNSSGGITNAGAIAGATTITSTGIFSSSATPTLVGLNVGQGAFSVAATGVTVTNALTATSAKISDLTNNRLVLAGADGELEDNAKLTFDGADLTLGASTRLIAVEAEVSGDLTLSGTSDHAVAVAADSVYFLDATSGKVRRDTFVDLVSAIAGGGLTATAGVLSTQAGAVSGGMDGGTATEGYNYFTGTVNAAIKLPASPSNGDVVTIKAGNTTAGQNITINCQGSHLIDQDATNIHLESPYAAITLVYMRANDWRLV